MKLQIGDQGLKDREENRCKFIPAITANIFALIYLKVLAFHTEFILILSYFIYISSVHYTPSFPKALIKSFYQLCENLFGELRRWPRLAFDKPAVLISSHSRPAELVDSTGDWCVVTRDLPNLPQFHQNHVIDSLLWYSQLPVKKHRETAMLKKPAKIQQKVVS